MENNNSESKTMLGQIATLVESWCEGSESTTLEAVECLIQELTDMKILLAKEWLRNV